MKSTRLKQKALADIRGRAMVEWIIERLRSAKLVDEIILCTSTHPDDQVLIDRAKQWGVRSFAGSQRDVLDRFSKAAKVYEADHIIRVTGDNPLTCPESLDNMIAHHLKTGADYTRTNGMPIGTAAEVMTTSMLEPLACLIPDPAYSGYMVLYAFDPEHFHCEVLDAPAEVNRPRYGLTVDTPDDLERMRQIFKNVPSGLNGPRLADVVEYMDRLGETGVEDCAVVKLPGGETMTFGAFQEMMDARTCAARRQTER
ncbi:MAG: NTP transferase domain-containing protein [Proteobacteria bacterium]|nr:NTP transferase domain-containing protein [Pseudomonadota bacterium]